MQQGIVTATTMGRNTVLQLNRHHLAAGIADQLAARADGGPESDIDLLVVRPALLGEPDKQLSSRILAALPLSARDLEVTPVSPEAWHGDSMRCGHR